MKFETLRSKVCAELRKKMVEDINAQLEAKLSVRLSEEEIAEIKEDWENQIHDISTSNSLEDFLFNLREYEEDVEVIDLIIKAVITLK